MPDFGFPILFGGRPKFEPGDFLGFVFGLLDLPMSDCISHRLNKHVELLFLPLTLQTTNSWKPRYVFQAILGEILFSLDEYQHPEQRVDELCNFMHVRPTVLSGINEFQICSGFLGEVSDHS